MNGDPRRIYRACIVAVCEPVSKELSLVRSKHCQDFGSLPRNFKNVRYFVHELNDLQNQLKIPFVLSLLRAATHTLDPDECCGEAHASIRDVVNKALGSVGLIREHFTVLILLRTLLGS